MSTKAMSWLLALFVATTFILVVFLIVDQRGDQVTLSSLILADELTADLQKENLQLHQKLDDIIERTLQVFVLDVSGDLVPVGETLFFSELIPPSNTETEAVRMYPVVDGVRFFHNRTDVVYEELELPL